MPICKFNIDTVLRMAFGDAMRETVNRDPERLTAALSCGTHGSIKAATHTVIHLLGAPLQRQGTDTPLDRKGSPEGLERRFRVAHRKRFHTDRSTVTHFI